MKAALRSIVVSWDFAAAVLATLALYFVLPASLSASILKSLYEVGISVLALIFSVFFAALAILITAGDNEFVRYLEKEGLYGQIMFTFRVTLIVLFLALLFSIASFVTILPYAEAQVPFAYGRWQLLVFSFISMYALLASIASTMDAIRYAEYRARFLTIAKARRVIKPVKKRENGRLASQTGRKVH